MRYKKKFPYKYDWTARITVHLVDESMLQHTTEMTSWSNIGMNDIINC